MNLQLKPFRPLTRRDCFCALACGNVLSDICILSARPFWCSSHYIEEQRPGRLPVCHMLLIQPISVGSCFNEAAGCDVFTCVICLCVLPWWGYTAWGCLRVWIWKHIWAALWRHYLMSWTPISWCLLIVPIIPNTFAANVVTINCTSSTSIYIRLNRWCVVSTLFILWEQRQRKHSTRLWLQHKMKMWQQKRAGWQPAGVSAAVWKWRQASISSQTLCLFCLSTVAKCRIHRWYCTICPWRCQSCWITIPAQGSLCGYVYITHTLVWIQII